MGLAASQARLLSLTNRQHSVESEAQRLENFKLQLAKNSDAVYQTYLNALDATIIMTKQTDAYGDTGWVSGSINNLMRYGTSDDDDTTGNVFFVQDVATGYLYVPETVGEKYDQVISSGDTEADARSFAELFGVTYEKKDYNEDVLTNYQTALDNGWDQLMDETLYAEYVEACANDIYTRNLAVIALSYLPDADSSGLYLLDDDDTTSGGSFLTALENIIKSGTYYDDTYTDEEKAVLEGAYNLFTMLTETLAETQYEDLDPEQYDDYDGKTINLYNYITGYANYAAIDSALSTLTGNSSGIYVSFDGSNKLTLSYSTSTSATDSSGTTYLSSDDSSTYSANDIFEMLLNGGTATMSMIQNEYVYDKDTGEEVSDTDYTIDSSSFDIYTYDSSSGTSSSSILSSYGASTYGEALTTILTNVASSTSYVDDFLSTNGLTSDDVSNYKKYLSYLADYESYSPSYYYVPDDSVLAAWCEEVYAAITAAGGYITVSDTQAKNASWVTNMVKNAQVVLTTYDSDDGTLSKTSASLNTSLKEVTDDSAIEEADAEYEYQMALINNKDSQYDTKLEMLETERSAISTEIDSLKTIAEDNVKSTFSLFT